MEMKLTVKAATDARKTNLSCLQFYQGNWLCQALSSFGFGGSHHINTPGGHLGGWLPQASILQGMKHLQLLQGSSTRLLWQLSYRMSRCCPFFSEHGTERGG